MDIDVLATPPDLELDVADYYGSDFLFAEVYHEKLANLNPRDIVMLYALLEGGMRS